MDPSVPIFLLIGGAVLFFIGGIIALVNIKNMKRRSRIINTPTSPIAQAPGNGPVEIKGNVLPGEQGVVMAPFSGRQAVWAKILVQEYRSSGRSGYWANVISETDFRPFYVDDGSGQRARIDAQGANIILESNTVASSGTFQDASPHVQAFVASRGISTTNFLGFNKRMRYSEEVLLPGSSLYALGPSRREAGPPVSDGYRMVPGSQLVMFAMPGDVGELILTNKTEEQLVSKFYWTFMGGLIAAGFGTLLGIVGGVSFLFVGE